MFAWDKFVQEFVDKQGYLKYFEGLLNTVLIAVFGLLFGFLLGSLLSVFKVVPSKRNPFLIVLKKIVDLYVTLFRGTPMVVQLLLIHFVIFPLIHLDIKSIIINNYVLEGVVIEAIIAYSLNSAAYICEIMRGGINSVDKGQLEAGRAVGLSYSKTMVSIIIPQAFKNVLPTLGNEFIALIKETSVASFIAVVDIYRVFERIGESTYDFIVPYLMLALTYLVMVILISIGVKALEKKFKKDQR